MRIGGFYFAKCCFYEVEFFFFLTKPLGSLVCGCVQNMICKLLNRSAHACLAASDVHSQHIFLHNNLQLKEFKKKNRLHALHALHHL